MIHVMTCCEPHLKNLGAIHKISRPEAEAYNKGSFLLLLLSTSQRLRFLQRMSRELRLPWTTS